MFATIYQNANGDSVYDFGGNTIDAKTGKVYVPPSSSSPASTPTPPAPGTGLNSIALENTSTQTAQPGTASALSATPDNPTPTSTAPVSTPTPFSTLTTSLTAAGATPQQAAQLAAPATTPTTYSKASSYTGTSIVDFLTLAGQPSDINSRTALAQKYGIANYTGTADQNLELLDLLKHAAGGVSATGMPNNTGSVLNVGSTPTPTTPISLDSLGSSGGKGIDVSSILGANGGSNPSLSGLLSLIGAPLPGQDQYNKIASDLTTAENSLGNEGADTAAAYAAPGGVNDIQSHIADLSTQAASLKAELDQFDVGTEQGMSKIGDQAIPTGLITGQQAQYQKQRDLTRASKAATLAGITSLVQAYQGNLTTAMQLAKDSVSFKYAPVEASINALKDQLSIASNELSQEDKTKSSIVSVLANYATTQLNTQKDNATKLQTLGVEAASGGAPLALVQQAINSGDPVQAATILSQYLKGPTESVSSSSATTFSKSQINNGAQNAGVSIDQFGSLNTDVQNFFVNAPPAQLKAFNDAKAAVADGSKDVASAVADINNSTTLPASVKTYLVEQLQGAAPAGGGGSGFVSDALNAIGSAGAGVYNYIKGALGF